MGLKATVAWPAGVGALAGGGGRVVTRGRRLAGRKEA